MKTRLGRLEISDREREAVAVAHGLEGKARRAYFRQIAREHVETVIADAMRQRAASVAPELPFDDAAAAPALSSPESTAPPSLDTPGEMESSR